MEATRDGATEQWRLFVDDRGGGSPVKATDAEGAAWAASAENLWSALRELRLRLDAEGVRLGLNAARREVQPSRMALQMGGSRMAYSVRLGNRATRLDILAPAPVTEAVTVEEHDAHHRLWPDSLVP